MNVVSDIQSSAHQLSFQKYIETEPVGEDCAVIEPQSDRIDIS